ncbi:hypothetical protein HY085_02155 [Candidatus Gottesmanbacteria bacterium]|nr:hypothetical protein [Candidatus Gottesmanbacteria bacterium]
MVIFIDESGTHKQEGNATTTVVYVEIIKLEKFQEALKEIVKKLRLESFY